MSYFNSKGIFAVVLVTLGITVFALSCSKTSDSAATGQFIGKWTGIMCDTGKTSVTISTGPTNYTLYMAYAIGSDTCAQNISLLGTVSSDISSNFSMGTQIFHDKCGTSYSISGGGTVQGDSIIITTYTQSSSAGIRACTFVGRH